MSSATAQVPTAHASRYLQQLCKHWSHKFPVDFTPQHGRIDLPVAVCTLDAGDAALTLHLEAPADQIERLEGVVAEHLQRFAFKEDLRIEWSAAG
jgi:hypothetical protein